MENQDWLSQYYLHLLNELIDQKRILLENRWEKIKDENQWGKLEKGTEKPNWICKDCYDGGIILENSINH